MLLRQEVPDDAEQAAEVHVAAWRSGYRGIMPAPLLAALDPAAWAQGRRRSFDQPDDPFTRLVADDDGRVVGFVWFGPYRDQDDHSWRDPAYGEILAIYVRPDRWGSGIGKDLILAALDSLPQAEVRLWVLAANERAIGFYQRHGFMPDGTTATYRPRGSDVDLPEIRLTLTRSEV